MSTCPFARAGARNLLMGCAGIDLMRGARVLVVREDPALGWYDGYAADAVIAEAEALGLTVDCLHVGAPDTETLSSVDAHVQAYDVTVFFARLGDLDRFAERPEHTVRVMAYTRDHAMLGSEFGTTPHAAMRELKLAIDRLMLAADDIHVQCGLGTDYRGRLDTVARTAHRDVSVRRFPLGVPQPTLAQHFSGRVAVAHHLVSTGTRIDAWTVQRLPDTVVACIDEGRIQGFDGPASACEMAELHLRRVAELGGLDWQRVHSWHAGIHPGCGSAHARGMDPDRWANTVFCNPRLLHFHSVGESAPGEVSWAVTDPTISLDGRALWCEGRLQVEAFEQTQHVLERWPLLSELWSKPVASVGLG
ncbi:MAG: hypothetical protein AAGA11_11165 [Pseudomonadota bacterium]